MTETLSLNKNQNNKNYINTSFKEETDKKN